VRGNSWLGDVAVETSHGEARPGAPALLSHAGADDHLTTGKV
jgi:hypothetical protein